MRLNSSWFGYKGIKFCNVAIGDIAPLAQIKLNKKFRGVRLTGTLYLVWEDACIRIRWIDKMKFKSEFHLDSQEINNLEKILYWEYAKIVRDYVYDSRTSPFDYSKILGDNLRILRNDIGLEIVEAADILKTSPSQLMTYEAGKADIELELKKKKEDSVIYKAANFYGVSVFDILSISLLCYKPIKNIKIQKEKMKNTLMKYHAGRISNI